MNSSRFTRSFLWPQPSLHTHGLRPQQGHHLRQRAALASDGSALPELLECLDGYNGGYHSLAHGHIEVLLPVHKPTRCGFPFGAHAAELSPWIFRGASGSILFPCAPNGSDLLQFLEFGFWH